MKYILLGTTVAGYSHFLPYFILESCRPGRQGGEGHPEAKFVRPTFLSQFGGADFENACYTGVQGGGAFACNLGLKPRFPKI